MTATLIQAMKTIPFQTPMQDRPKCPICGTGLIQKSRSRLLVVGFCLIASVGLAFVVPVLCAPGILAALTGLFLVVWATMWKSRWCRRYKIFRIG